jgi:zinc and cadmium transporter
MVTILLLTLPILITGAVAFRLRIGQTGLRLILAFSAGYLFSLAMIHMMPEVFQGQGIRTTGLFIVLGFCIQLLIDTFSAGIEHGHVHLHSNVCHKHLPYGIIIGLYLHSFLEGLPVYDLHATHTGHINYQLVLGLAVHNLPITIAFVALLREHEQQASKRWLLLLCFALMSPLGYAASYLLQTVGLQDYEMYGRFAYALVIGIFLHISTAILFESSVNHKYNLKKVAVMACGIIFAYLIS